MSARIFIIICFSLIVSKSRGYVVREDLSENLIKSIIVTQPQTKGCNPVILLPKDQSRPNYFGKIFNEIPQQILVEEDGENYLELSEEHHYKFQYSKACSLVIYFLNNKGLDVFNPGFLNKLKEDFIRNLPGGFFYTYHVVFSSGVYKNVAEHKPLPQLLFQMHYLLFVFESSSSRASLQITIPDRWINSSLFDANYENDEFSRNVDNLLFQERWKNYKGKEIIITTTPDSTQEQMEDFMRTKDRHKHSYSTVSTYEAFRFMNATPRINTVKSAIYGHKLKNGTWIGMIGEVIKGKADATTATQLLPDRAKVVEFTSTYHYDQVVFISALSRKAEPNGNLEFLATPFGPFVWLFLSLTFIATYITLFLKVLLAKNSEKIWKSKWDNLWILNLMLRPMIDQTGDTPSLHKRLEVSVTRFIFGLWLIALIVLSCGYKSKLIAALLAPTFENPPKTFAELAESNYGIGAVLYNESFIGESFSKLHNKIGNEVRKRVKGYRAIDPECYAITQRKNEICMSIKAFIEPIAYNYLTDKNGQPLFRISSDGLFPVTAGMGVSKKFPHLKELVSTFMSRSQSQGLMGNYWYHHANFGNSIRGRRFANLLAKTVDPTPSSDSSNQDQEIQHYITILGLGLGMSVGIFSLEVIFNFLGTKVERKFKSLINSLLNYQSM